MSDATAGLLQIGLLVVVLAAVHVPLGDFMARTFTGARHLRVERGLYRVLRVDGDAEVRWPTYALGVLGFSTVSILFLYAFLRLQHFLPLSLGMAGMEPTQAWNTAVSFVGNTNWQSYSGESAVGHLVQMAGLAVQNFLSAAVGLAVAVALVRGLVSRAGGTIGNFWVDLTRATLRILLPLSVLGAVALLLTGVVQNFSGGTTYTTLAGGTQTIVGGPIASQEVIKELGTNGGGFFNANSAHPFENPTPFSNLFEILLILVIPFSLPRTYGTMVGDRRQGNAILAVMGAVFTVSLAVTTWSETRGYGAVPQAVGSAMEGKETRFGEWASTLFATATTSTSTGAVNSFHDSYTPLGGGTVMLNMMMGEVTPGGVGSGLYGMLVLAIITVFVAGLMVGRTPEYLGKSIRQKEITYAALYILVTPGVLLTGSAIALSDADTRSALLNSGPHGLTEMLYAFASAANNNGSAFAGLSANTPFYNTALGLAIYLGRFLPMVFVLALAGAFAAQKPAAATAGTLPTRTPTFAGMHLAVVVVVTALTFFPALALGPIAEAVSGAQS
ncbi:potassium-transporting ATPase subunit KdpA [Kineococcus rhizosphaerae]|uniref:Potassium-transporting ATPase potassium-binding subunit n=1 Tax=Kineococcus rhizosphaerae TaxID=559628 RepID=A0A2T0R4P8_9ACTN|nr:potassium-transporting ATPase subunit KdpA [Kineococcus rhizosphaerae]PRY15335.1 K+-transporting ATPase ATPase A chain [Kineococcus rhizosphaerae]